MKAYILFFSLLGLTACGGSSDGDFGTLVENPDSAAVANIDDSGVDTGVANDGEANDGGENPDVGNSSIVLTEEDQQVLASLWFPPEVAPSASGEVRTKNFGTLYNAEAVIPPQCYTKHEGQYNPCMTCHQTYPFGSRPNSMNDGNLQSHYGFSDLGFTNHWKNLFEDRRNRMAAISDQSVIDYIYTDNYSPLIEGLKTLDDWQGPIPEIANLHRGAEAFDEFGFAKDGSHWVAFNYMPLPSTFWPTNGSTDDVMIRLPEAFRTTTCQPGYSRDTYLANLSILEAAIKDIDRISVPEIDEGKFCTDLNGDGELGLITEIIRPQKFVGAAEDIPVTVMLYPVGTEFLHTVRYVGIADNGEITLAPRMKEVRYMNKFTFFDEGNLASMYGNERQEKIDGLLPKYIHRGDRGTDNSFGWMLLGFIEGEDGHLRMQSEEEQLFCMGCHTTIGSTIDQTFAFSRKVTGAAGWKYIDLQGMQDAPYVGGYRNEIAHYLETVGGGNEFRENEETVARYFHEDGSLNENALAGLDVYRVITPSLRRALDLNKAYMTIVRDQDYILGRDANLAPATNVYDKVPEGAPVLPAERRVQWDMRLNWPDAAP